MPPSSASPVRLASAGAAAPLSRPRKKFNTLIKKLESERQRLAAWRDVLPQVQRLMTQEMAPLERQVDAQNKRLIVLLDRAHGHKSLSRAQRDKIEHLIRTVAEELLDSDDDPEVAALYRKYADEDPFGDEMDEEGDEAFHGEAFRETIRQLFGVELDPDADISSPEAVFAAMRAKAAGREQPLPPHGQREHGGAREAEAPAGHEPHTARHGKRERQREAEAARLRQSVRDIYRKLASALHPDREKDEAERQRKTALMQRVNIAYEKNDLLGLLELQLEIEQIDQASLDNLAEDRIEQYNRILQEQVNDIAREVSDIEFALQMEIGLEMGPGRRPAPKTLLAQMRAGVDDLRRALAELERELLDLSDMKKLKAFLKSYRIPDEDPFGDFWFD